MCNTNLKILLSKKSHSLTISDNFSVKNHEMIENAFFMNVEKNNKTFCQQKSFSVFGGALLNASESSKTFFWQSVLLNFFQRSWKMHFL